MKILLQSPPQIFNILSDVGEMWCDCVSVGAICVGCRPSTVDGLDHKIQWLLEICRVPVGNGWSCQSLTAACLVFSHIDRQHKHTHTPLVKKNLKESKNKILLESKKKILSNVATYPIGFCPTGYNL